MLAEPPEDPARLAQDRALAKAVRARMAGGPRPTPDADAIALRSLLKDLSAPEAAAVRSVLGRIDAGHGGPLIVWGPASQVLAADRYGLVARIAAKPEAALKAAHDGGRALMDLTASSAWWGRLLAEPELRVTAALPDHGAAHPRALMVQKAASGPTGDDRTFWITDSSSPAGRIVSALGASGLAAGPLIEAGGLKLFALAGYVQPTDGRLSDAPGSLKGVIGAAPVF
ncbi:hypothetical protein N0B44_16605 [Roseibacterium beibuensis]|uniref:hypothetical protein n=1 Tax=[Roseibacterium] beibuensis TaxID=1193142 RepID=UPI00217DCDDB|nr:hypothetical protein [Roseibacterium beibuensis]MCS6624541.1 hypothetical protein [Roseibacterium beibuensis]